MTWFIPVYLAQFWCVRDQTWWTLYSTTYAVDARHVAATFEKNTGSKTRVAVFN